MLIVTVVHDPDDARIRYRQLTALLAAGIEVTYAAPFEATHRRPPDGVTALELPRAAGRQRFTAIAAARRLLHRIGPEHDLVLLHDPELLLAVPGLDRHRPPLVVWDVHEDTAAALRMKSWLPRPARPVAVWPCGPPSAGPRAGVGCCWPRRATAPGSDGNTRWCRTAFRCRTASLRRRVAIAWSTWAGSPGPGERWK